VIKPSPWIKTTQFPSVILAGAALFLLAYLTLLSPSSLEDDFLSVRVVHPRDLLSFMKSSSDPILAKGIPEGTTPAYSLRNFDFFITNHNQPELQFTALKSNFYQEQQLVHAQSSMVTLQDGTIASSQELIYDTAHNEIHFYGDVLITFTNGALIRTNYLKAVTRPTLSITVPLDEAVSGEKQEKSSTIRFKSYGLTYRGSTDPELLLSSKVNALVSAERSTQVRSDRARMIFNRKKMTFFMDDRKAFDQQFVLTHQDKLEMKSRSLEIALESSGAKRIAALNDVTIRENSFYSTSGKAVFEEAINTIELSDFPQVYQDRDTITGDIILYHRNDDTIEVKQSNAIYQRN
jgi:hypothetical protein